MLEAAATGHSGGLSTIHANSCDEALTRLARLAQCDQQFIREVIDLVVFIERMPDGRQGRDGRSKSFAGEFTNLDFARRKENETPYCSSNFRLNPGHGRFGFSGYVGDAVLDTVLIPRQYDHVQRLPSRAY